jgi:phloretin hydrolase
MGERAELTAEDKAKPYAKYYYLPSAPPAPHHAEMLRDLQPLDPAKADRIQDLDRLLEPGYTEGENGYCVLPDGSACVALRHPMPGATPEMIDWWFAWHGLEDLRYRLWYPEMHVSARVDPEDRVKILDPERPMRLKFQGMTHHVVEDIGGGVLNAVDISFLTPEDFGFDASRFRPPNAEALAAANVVARGTDDPPDGPGLPVAFVHLVRKTDDGIEVRNRFWVGYQVRDKKPVLALPEGMVIPEEAAQGLFLHDVQEFANLAAILPQLYDEMEGKVD